MTESYDAIQTAIVRADRARKLKDAIMEAYDGSVLDLAQAAAISVAPQSPAATAGNITTEDPNDYGCPDSADLAEWVFAPKEGAGRPEGLPDPAASGACEWFEFRPVGRGAQTDRGLVSGIPDTASPVFRNGRAVWSRWWGINGHLAGLTVENVDFVETQGEHDVYIKYSGGGDGYYLSNIYSIGTGSQVFQGARREWELDPELWEAAPGSIHIDGWLAVDHARHPAEGGTGTRRSQAFKFFSQQAGKHKSDQRDEQVPASVSVSRVTLDDTMQGTSHGGFFLGDYLSTSVSASAFAGGNLESHFTIDGGVGPVTILDCTFDYKSAELGRGIRLRSLDRPVKIHPCGGNLRIYGPDGQVLSHVTDGYESPTWMGEE